MRHPPLIHYGLDQTRKGRGRDALWPRVLATPRAFFKKAQGLRPHLFQATDDAFTRSILPKAPPVYASWLGRLRARFPEVLIVDGSRLDAIGDRLYASLQYFHQLATHQLSGLVRRNGRLLIRRVRLLSSQQDSRSGLLEDGLVEVGCGVGQPKLTLRLIRYRGQGRRLDLLTNVLEPTRLRPEEALALYRLRWSVERLFFDLKETLDLHGLYASHPNLVAQQVYAAAIVHTAFRVAQAGIAKQARVLPEQLSPAKLFPKLAQAANDHCAVRVYALKTLGLNPGVAIRFPGWHTIPSAYTTLGAIVVQHRHGHRRRRKCCAARRRWTSFAHVTGGPTLLQSVSDG